MVAILIISGAVLIIFFATRTLYRYRPDDMSEISLRHFQTGVLFAGFATAALVGYYSLSYVIQQTFTPYQCLRFDFLFTVIVFGGNLCNAISVFYFLRELIPGGEITPEGMSAGLLMSIEQVLWILTGIMFALRNGF